MEWLMGNLGLVIWSLLVIGLCLLSFFRENDLAERMRRSELRIGEALDAMSRRLYEIHESLVEEGRWNWSVWCCWMVLSRYRDNPGQRVDYQIVHRTDWSIEIRFWGFPWSENTVVVFTTDPAGFPTLCESGAPKPARIRPYAEETDGQNANSTIPEAERPAAQPVNRLTQPPGKGA